jgi:hypothetical protein
MFKSFSKKPTVDIHMLEQVEGDYQYGLIDTDKTLWEANKIVNDIAIGLENPVVKEVNEGFEATGFTPDGAKVIIGAYEQSAFKAGSIDY